MNPISVDVFLDDYWSALFEYFQYKQQNIIFFPSFYYDTLLYFI